MKAQSELSIQEEQALGIYCTALRGLYQALLPKVVVFLFSHGGVTLVDLQQVETFLQTLLNCGEILWRCLAIAKCGSSAPGSPHSPKSRGQTNVYSAAGAGDDQLFRTINAITSM